MTIYFTWIDKEEIFNPEKHCCEDVPLFHLSLQQKENGFAFARITMPLLPLSAKKYAFISYKKRDNPVVLLFKGRVWETPVKFVNQTVQFELTSQGEESHQKIYTLHQQLKKTPYWDPLFVAPKQYNNPSESLENRSALYHWDRTSDTVHLSDIFEGRSYKDINNNFWNESLNISFVKTPLSHITVHLEAQWLQHYQGVLNIGKFLKNRFPFGLISSFTGNDLQQRWPLSGQSLGRSGYKILYSQLKEVNPASTGVLNLFPTLSPPLIDNSKTHPKTVHLKRTWFQPSLLVGWEYRQKRKEVVKITLKNALQLSKEYGINHKHLHLRLHSIAPDRPIQPWSPEQSYGLFDLVEYQGKVYRCKQPKCTENPTNSPHWTVENETYGLKNPAQGTFFLTERGYQAVGHAIDIARAHLAASSRAIKIEFKTSWEALADISLDHTLRIQDERLPHGAAIGKVAEYQFIAEGEKRWLSVVLLCAIGLPSSPILPPQSSKNEYCESTYLQPEKMPLTPSGMPFPRFDHQTPQEGVLCPWGMKMNDMIQKTFLENTAEQQLESLKTFISPLEITKELKKIPTKIRIPLKSLSAKPRLEHTFVLDLPCAWSAPCQIMLKR